MLLTAAEVVSFSGIALTTETVFTVLLAAAEVVSFSGIALTTETAYTGLPTVAEVVSFSGIDLTTETAFTGLPTVSEVVSFSGIVLTTETAPFQSLDELGCPGDMRVDSAEILFQSFLQEALVSSYSMCRDVHSLMLSNQHFLSRPRRRPPSKMP